MKRLIYLKILLLEATFLSVLPFSFVAVLSVQAQSTIPCQCVVYVQNLVGTYFPVEGAKDMSPLVMSSKGYQEVLQPVKGAIVVFQPSYTQYNTVNQQYGHVGIISDFLDKGNYWQIKVRSANSGSSTFPEAGCNNVNDIWYNPHPKNASSVKYFVKNVTPSPVTDNTFKSPTSSLKVSVPSVDLTVQGTNIAGRTVYVQMYRPAFATYSAKSWSFQQVANSNTVVFSDMDGAGNTFQGVPYSTVVSLTPFTSNEASMQRTSCFAATGGTRLCDRVSR